MVGQTSYYSIGKSLGIDPYSLRVIMRNPIYTGWRVIDKREIHPPWPTRQERTADRQTGRK